MSNPSSTGWAEAMKRIFAHVLKKFGAVDFDLLVRRAKAFPAEEAIRSGEVVFVIDGGVQKWACLKCPGGCGTMIPLSLSPARRPRWSIVSDWLQRPTPDRRSPSQQWRRQVRCYRAAAPSWGGLQVDRRYSQDPGAVRAPQWRFLSHGETCRMRSGPAASLPETRACRTCSGPQTPCREPGKRSGDECPKQGRRQVS